MKTVQILTIKGVSSAEDQNYIMDIAARYHQEWGKYRGLTVMGWYKEICADIESGNQKIKIAINPITKKMISVLTLKKQNMQDEKRYEKHGPWLSGAFTEESERTQGIMALLGREMLREEVLGKYEKINVFAHDQSKTALYKRWGAEVIVPLSGEASYTYANAPITLFEGDPQLIFKRLDDYVSQHFAVTESGDGVRNYTIKSRPQAKTQPVDGSATLILAAPGTAFHASVSSTASSSASSTASSTSLLPSSSH